MIGRLSQWSCWAYFGFDSLRPCSCARSRMSAESHSSLVRQQLFFLFVSRHLGNSPPLKLSGKQLLAVYDKQCTSLQRWRPQLLVAMRVMRGYTLWSQRQTDRQPEFLETWFLYQALSQQRIGCISLGGKSGCLAVGGCGFDRPPWVCRSLPE